MHRYGVASHHIRSLDAVENFVYQFEREKQSYILRIGHSLCRSKELIQGEVDWINYLAAGGVPVSKAIGSEAGKLVEEIDDRQGGQFLVTAFVMAQGEPPYDHCCQYSSNSHATYPMPAGTGGFSR